LIKILAISGSPVAGASTDIILHKLTEMVVNELGAGVTAETSFIKLSDLKYIPCQACGKAPTPELCFWDDLNEAYELLKECNCLLFGSPVYFDSVSAQSKAFIDRCNCFRPADFDDTDPEHNFLKLLKEKRTGAIVLVGGENGYYEGARRVIAGFFMWIEVVNEGLITYTSPDFKQKGTAADDTDLHKNIADLGKHIASQLLRKTEQDNV
jgi:multimeric flavodoxin WrbA